MPRAGKYTWQYDDLFGALIKEVEYTADNSVDQELKERFEVIRE